MFDRKVFLLLIVLLPMQRLHAQVPVGDRTLAFAVEPAAGQDFDSAFDLAQQACMKSIHQFYPWDAIEPSPGRFSQAFLGTVAASNVFFPLNQTKVELNIPVINTVARQVPPDLENVAFDSPVFIDRFNVMLDTLFARMPDVELVALNIGNELGPFLGDSTRVAQYKGFFDAVKLHAEALYLDLHGTDLNVGMTLQFSTLVAPTFTPLMKRLTESADILSLTYYAINADFTVRPPEEVLRDFDDLVMLYKDAGKPIYFVECGYPSSPVCNGTEALQKTFVENVFQAWDTHKDVIKYISFFQLTDWSQQTVDELGVFFGLPNDLIFKEYLRSLGLRTRSGRSKPAYEALICQAAARGFCATDCNATLATDLPLLPPGKQVGMFFGDIEPAGQVGQILDAALTEAFQHGMNAVEVPFDWKDLESDSGVVVTDAFEQALINTEGLGLRPYIFIGTTPPEIPSDLIDPVDSFSLAQGKRFDDPDIIERFGSLLDAVVPILVKHGGFYISISNEINLWLREDFPEQRGPFLRFLAAARDRIHTSDPRMAVGTTLSVLAEEAATDTLAQQLLAVSDAACFNYYPVNFSDNTVKDPAVIPAELDALFLLAGDKQVLFQEVGFPAGYDSATTIGSSTEFQRQAISNIFAVLANQPQARFISVFKFVDFEPSTCAHYAEVFGFDEPGVPKLARDRFVENTCTVGLRRLSDGSARPAWTEFLDALQILITGVEAPSPRLPAIFLLRQNYPNPFNPTTTIRYQLPQAGRVVLTIYNLFGQPLRVLVNQGQSAGEHAVVWDGRNQAAVPVASGMYFYSLRVGETLVATRKALLLK